MPDPHVWKKLRLCCFLWWNSLHKRCCPTVNIPPPSAWLHNFLYRKGQFSAVAYCIALPIFATLKVSSGFFSVIRSSFVFRKHSCSFSKALAIGLIAMCIGWIWFSFMKHMFSWWFTFAIRMSFHSPVFNLLYQLHLRLVA